MKKLVIIPGGFHPFHAGHKALYDAARAAFPTADIYVAATADTSTRPFPFAIKEKLAQLAGIPPHRFIQVKSPFRAEEITQHFDPMNTQLIFVRSEKDRDQQPRPGGTKKDGTPGYLQPYKRNGLQPMSQHGYMAYLPVVQFGPGMTSATEIRAKWPGMSAEDKVKLVNQLYPITQGNDKLSAVTVKLLDQGMAQPMDENFGGASSLVGVPIGGGAMSTKTLRMPNGPEEIEEDPTEDEPMTPTYTPGETFGLSSGSVEDVAEQGVGARQNMIKQIFQSGSDFVKHLNSVPNSELEALYHQRPQMRDLMKKLHAHINEAMQGKVLDAPSHQAQDYVEEN